MKKLLMAIIATGVMATNAFSIVGTVTAVQTLSDGTMRVTVDNGSITLRKDLLGTTEALKAMYATVLTAKTTGSPLFADEGIYETKSGWVLIEIR